MEELEQVKIFVKSHLKNLFNTWSWRKGGTGVGGTVGRTGVGGTGVGGTGVGGTGVGGTGFLFLRLGNRCWWDW